MKSSYKHIIINCGRSYDDSSKVERKKRFDDEEPYTGKIREHKSKSQVDRQHPIIRMLEKNCGRPWSKVWSEICKNADNRSIRGFHLREHVKEYVRTPIELEINTFARRGRAIPFIVDSHGILRKNLNSFFFERKPKLTPEQQEEVEKYKEESKKRDEEKKQKLLVARQQAERKLKESRYRFKQLKRKK